MQLKNGETDMAFGNVKPLMKENVVGAPPSKGMLKKKIFGKPTTPAKMADPFGKPSNAAPGANLFKRLTGK